MGASTSTLNDMVRRNDWDRLMNFLKTAGHAEKLESLKYMQKKRRSNGELDYSPVLSLAIVKKAPMPILREMIIAGGKQVVALTDCQGNTALHTACQFYPSPLLVHLLVDVGGKELILARTTRQKSTALHYICNSGLKMILLNEHGSVQKVNHARGEAADSYALGEMVKRMVEAAGEDGKDYVAAKDARNQTALMYACMGSDIPERAIVKMIEAGGKEALLLRNNKGMTALHVALWQIGSSTVRSSRKAVIDEMIRVGGAELLMIQGELGLTCLHVACSHGAPVPIIEALVDAGGRELALSKLDEKGLYANALRLALRYDRGMAWSTGTIKALIRIGGAELILMPDGKGQSAVDAMRDKDENGKDWIEGHLEQHVKLRSILEEALPAKDTDEDSVNEQSSSRGDNEDSIPLVTATLVSE